MRSPSSSTSPASKLLHLHYVHHELFVLSCKHSQVRWAVRAALSPSSHAPSNAALSLERSSAVLCNNRCALSVEHANLNLSRLSMGIVCNEGNSESILISVSRLKLKAITFQKDEVFETPRHTEAWQPNSFLHSPRSRLCNGGKSRNSSKDVCSSE